MKKARQKEKIRKSHEISRKKASPRRDCEAVKKRGKKTDAQTDARFSGKISAEGAAEIKHEKLYSVLTGIFAGLVNGVFGGGGGMIVVPMLVHLLKKEPRVAHATAILLILPMSITSGLFYAAFGSFRAEAGIPVTIGVVAGGILGAFLLGKMSSKFIVALFSVVMAAAGVKMLFF